MKTQGDILKTIRKDLGLKQHELAAEDISRNLISLIENNRASLNRSNAEILVKNINILCQQRGIDLRLEFSDLFIPGVYDAKIKAKKYIDELKHANENKLSLKNEKIFDITVFLSKWNLLPQSCAIFQLLGDHYIMVDDKVSAHISYVRAYENAVKIKDDYSFVLSLVPHSIPLALELERYYEALEFATIGKYAAKVVKSPLTDELSFYRAFVLYKLGKETLAKKELDTIETTNLTPELSAKLILLNASFDK